jgi:hypothetical protein
LAAVQRSGCHAALAVPAWIARQSCIFHPTPRLLGSSHSQSPAPCRLSRRTASPGGPSPASQGNAAFHTRLLYDITTPPPTRYYPAARRGRIVSFRPRPPACRISLPAPSVSRYNRRKCCRIVPTPSHSTLGPSSVIHFLCTRTPPLLAAPLLFAARRGGRGVRQGL